MVSSLTDCAQFALKRRSMTAMVDANALMAKYFKEISVLVNAEMTRFWIATETATPVVQTK